MNLLESALLGLVQGLTEFLPVSSSGHLVLAQSFLPGLGDQAIIFDVLLHGGTLAAVCVYFWKDIAALLKSFMPDGSPVHRKTGYMIIVGTLPTGIIAIAFRDWFATLFNAPRSAATMLLVTGVILWISEVAAKPRDSMADIGPGRSLAIGAVQGLAIIPGISRSGSTIGAASLLGIKAEEAARFSFLLSIPAVLGAVVLEVPAIEWRGWGEMGNYMIGTLVAFGSGLAAIKMLLATLRRKKFRWFGVYCWIVGVTYLVAG